MLYDYSSEVVYYKNDKVKKVLYDKMGNEYYYIRYGNKQK